MASVQTGAGIVADSVPELEYEETVNNHGQIRHRELKVEGVQFHPESILTTAEKRLLDNFLNL